MEIKNRIGKYLKQGRSWYRRSTSKITKITVHHTASDLTGKSDDEILQHHYLGHVGRGWPGLSYHFFITPSGNIYQINDLSWVTWHDSHNWDSIGIALEGYFHPPKNMRPTEAQLRSLRWLLDVLCTKHPEFPADFNDVYGHRERSATACPGDNLFPYVKEYRVKLGRVSWGSVPSVKESSSAKVEVEAKKFEELVDKSSKWDKVVEYFDLDSPDKIKSFVAGLKSRITDLENKLSNILEVEVEDSEGNRNKVEYYIREYVNCKNRVGTLEGELTKKEKLLKDCEKEKKEARKKIESLEGSLRGKDEEFQKEIKKKDDKIEELNAKIITLSNEKKALEDRIEALTKEKTTKYSIVDILDLLVKKLIKK